MPTVLSLLFAGLLCFAPWLPVWAAQAPTDTSKTTSLGLYLDAREACDMWSEAPSTTVVLDVRTPQEYAFVGHPAMAVNVPVKVFTARWSPSSGQYGLMDNPYFLRDVQSLTTTAQTILVMCSDGRRSAQAVNRLARAGYSHVYTVVDGFQGDLVSDADSYFLGKRVKNGWTNAGLDWTYTLDPGLVYTRAVSVGAPSTGALMLLLDR